MPADPVAVLGAGGTLGLPMARNLLAAGIDVRAWNRTAEKMEPLADRPAAAVTSSNAPSPRLRKR